MIVLYVWIDVELWERVCKRVADRVHCGLRAHRKWWRPMGVPFTAACRCGRRGNSLLLSVGRIRRYEILVMDMST